MSTATIYAHRFDAPNDEATGQIGGMAEVGAFLLHSETELLLKSRRVVPGRLLEAGFQFEEPEWAPAARRLVTEWPQARVGS